MALIVASCQKEYLSEETMRLIPGVERTITASACFPQSADKAHLNSLQNVVWDLGDALNINGTNVAINSIQNSGTVAKFYPGTIMANTLNGTDNYWAVYPTTLAGAYSGGGYLPADFSSTTSLSVHLPDTQVVNISADTLQDHTYMAAHASVAAGTGYVDFQMRNLGAVLKLNLRPKAGNTTSNRVDSIVFTSYNASLAGTFTVSDNATNPTITPAAGGTNKLVVKFQNGNNRYIDITGGKTVSVILPPLAGKNLNMRIYGDDARYTEKIAANASLNRNYIYTSIVSDIAFESHSYYGPFSVATGRQVYFAPGNLQWSATGGGATPTTHAVAGGGTADGTWRFAKKQWHMVGAANSNVSSTYNGWIDLFGWATSGYGGYQPYLTSSNTNDYLPIPQDLAGTNYDWGVYNNPSLPKGKGNAVWRTLTANEWDWLLNSRSTTTIVNGVSAARYAVAYLDTNSANGNTYTAASGLLGVIIFPDNAGTLTLSGSGSQWGGINVDGGYTTSTPLTLSTVSYSDWIRLEQIGCAFLPAAGDRSKLNVSQVGDMGRYWSGTFDPSTGKNSWSLIFSRNGIHPSHTRQYGICVRLAQNAQ